MEILVFGRNAKISPARLHDGVAFLPPSVVAVHDVLGTLWYSSFKYDEPSILSQRADSSSIDIRRK